MFKPEKDERLWRIELEAGMTAFLTYFFVALAIMIIRGLTDFELLSSPDFLIASPLIFTGLVFGVTAGAKGYFTSVNEEQERLKRDFSTRTTTVASIVTWIIGYFTIQRLNLFGEEMDSITADLMDACASGLLFAAVIWLINHRKNSRGKVV